jgi:hypothetical protein
MPDDQDASGMDARLRRVEDMLEIYNLIATHPPFADTGAMQYARKLWSDDAVFKRSDGQGRMSLNDMEAKAGDPLHAAAMDGGLAHFCGHPYVRVDGDTALAISYLQLLTPARDSEPVAIPGHGSSRGYFVHKVVVNRWHMVRTPAGWRVKDRVASSLDGGAAPRELLMDVLQG